MEERTVMTPLADLRKKAGMTQAQLAEACELLQPNLSKIESGKVKVDELRMKTGYRLSQALGCNMEDLLGAKPKRAAKKKKCK